jgi:16S rRNA (guanine966-N2)-methyltransferase
VREAIFSSLDARGVLPGARVVDLYAGSGALGLEAASRGATDVTLVERARLAVAACRSNIRGVLRNAPSPAPELRVIGQSVQSFLAGSVSEWDVALLDPPYELGAAELSAALELLAPRLAADAVVMVERRSRDPEPVWPAGIEPERRKDYGDTSLWWASGVSGGKGP